MREYRPGEPCAHPGCLNHVSHPCEGCGRIAGQYPTGGPPPHLQLMLARFSQGCEVCQAMHWRANSNGDMQCGNCGNVFDVPVIEEDFHET